MTSTGENAGGYVSGGEGGSGDGNGGRKGRKEGAVAVSAQAIQLSCSACLGGFPLPWPTSFWAGAMFIVNVTAASV